MALKLYMDHHVARAITDGLRERGVDVLTAFEDGSHELLDPELLDRVAELSRVLFTNDSDFSGRSSAATTKRPILYRGYICSTTQCFHWAMRSDLELIANAMEPVDMANVVQFLPL